MSCFDNLISFKGSCSDTTPTSGLYLDMLGFTLDQADDIVQGQEISGENLIADKITFAKEIIVNQITTHLADKFRSNSIIEGQRVGYYYDNQILVAGEANQLKGMRLELCNDDNFVDLFISEISLQVNTTGNVSVFVYDLIQNKLLDTLTVATVAGEVSSSYVNKTYKSKRKKLHLFIGYDSTAISSYQASVSRNGCATCGSGNGLTYLNQYLTAAAGKIGTASSKIYSNFSSLSDTGGVSLNYSIECNHEEWLCTIANRIALPLLYKTAAELYDYGLISQRSNDTTLIDSEKWKLRREEMEFKYREELDNVLKKIKLPSDNICFQCNDKSKNVIILP